MPDWGSDEEIRFIRSLYGGEAACHGTLHRVHAIYCVPPGSKK